MSASEAFVVRPRLKGGIGLGSTTFRDICDRSLPVASQVLGCILRALGW